MSRATQHLNIRARFCKVLEGLARRIQTGAKHGARPSMKNVCKPVLSSIKTSRDRPIAVTVGGCQFEWHGVGDAVRTHDSHVRAFDNECTV